MILLATRIVASSTKTRKSSVLVAETLALCHNPAVAKDNGHNLLEMEGDSMLVIDVVNPFGDLSKQWKTSDWSQLNFSILLLEMCLTRRIL